MKERKNPLRGNCYRSNDAIACINRLRGSRRRLKFWHKPMIIGLLFISSISFRFYLHYPRGSFNEKTISVKASYFNKEKLSRKASYDSSQLITECPFSPRSLSSIPPGSLPGYTGWIRPLSEDLSKYSVLYAGAGTLAMPSSANSEKSNYQNNLYQFLLEKEERKIKAGGSTNGDAHSTEAPLDEEPPFTLHQHDLKRDGPYWSVAVACDYKFIHIKKDAERDSEIGSIPKPCQSKNPIFYARAYGPAILGGTFKTVKLRAPSVILEQTSGMLKGGNLEPDYDTIHLDVDSTYISGTEIAFHFRTSGIYQIDIVLEAEDTIPYKSFPLSSKKRNATVEDLLMEEPKYLGWSIPGAPLFVQVTNNKKKIKSKDHLLEIDEDMRKTGDSNVTEAIPSQMINIPRTKVESIMRKHMEGEDNSDSFDVANVNDNFSRDKSDASSISEKKKWCTMDQLLRRDAGEWIVTGHHSDPEQMDHQKNNPNYVQDRGRLNQREPYASFQNYVNGYERLGMCTEWVHDDGCSIVPWDDFLPKNPMSPTKPTSNRLGTVLQSCLEEPLRAANSIFSHEKKSSYVNKLNVILIGDSVMKQTDTAFRNQVRMESTHEIKIHYIPTHSGLSLQIDNIVKALDRIEQNPGRHIIFFNAGLHDLSWYCPMYFEKWRNEHERVMSDLHLHGQGNCIDLYHYNLKKLVNVIAHYNAELKVFRSTNAGMMRWGNFGFGWDMKAQLKDRKTTHQQGMLIPHAASLFNDIAADIIEKCNNEKNKGDEDTECGKNERTSPDIKILDYFDLTYARPDNTEIESMENKIGAHFVHPGLSVSRFMARKMLMMIMWVTCKETLENMSF